MTTTITAEQRTAAKVAGCIYLVAMATSMFAELYLRGSLIVPRDAVQTALNITAAERFFRISSVVHLLTFASDAMLAVALYTILKPINRSVALLAAFWRLADCAILSVAVLNDFAALRFLAGTEYLRAFNPGQLQVLARVFLSIGAAGYQLGFVFLGLGSAVFSYLWLKSHYIPRALAAWGIFASLVLALITVAILIFPRLGAIGLSYMAPMFFYEVGLGLWLLVKGLRPPTASTTV
jgi:hypothetical protein